MSSRNKISLAVKILAIFFSLTLSSELILAKDNDKSDKSTKSSKSLKNDERFEEFQAQVDSLQQQVDALVSGSVYRASVDCSNGESVNEVLASVASTTPLEITMIGVCEERVALQRDDVTIQGANPTDGFKTPANSNAVLAANGSSRIFLKNLTIDNSAGFWAVGCYHNSVIVSENVSVQGGVVAGYLALDGGQCRLKGGEVNGAQTGVMVQRDAHADIEGVFITNSRSTGVLSYRDGSVSIEQNTFLSNNGIGVRVAEGSYAYMSGIAIDGSAQDGVVVVAGSSSTMNGSVSISSSGGNGVSIESNSTVALGGSPVISASGGWGLVCSADSTITGGTGQIDSIDCP